MLQTGTGCILLKERRLREFLQREFKGAADFAELFKGWKKLLTAEIAEQLRRGHKEEQPRIHADFHRSILESLNPR